MEASKIPQKASYNITSVSPKHELQNHRNRFPEPSQKQTLTEADKLALGHISIATKRQTNRGKKHQRQPRTMSHLRRSSRQAPASRDEPRKALRRGPDGRSRGSVGGGSGGADDGRSPPPRALARSPIASATARSGPGRERARARARWGWGRGGGAAPDGGSSSSDAEAGGLVGWWWRATRPRHDRRREEGG